MKRFIKIPLNTANHTLELIAGDLGAQARDGVTNTRVRLDAHERGIEIEPGPREYAKPLKYLPSTLAVTLRTIYGSRCREHSMMCVRTTHLAEFHNVDLNLPWLLR
jgi:hypothetical protein